MALNMKYTSGKASKTYRLKESEIEVFTYLAKNGYGKEMECILGVSDFGKKSNINYHNMLQSIENIIKNIESHVIGIPYMYGTKEEFPRGSGQYSIGFGGSLSDYDANGENFDLDCGLDKCEMRRKWQDENGKIHYDEPQDVRHLSVIKTNSQGILGDIHIIKKRKPTQLKKYLEDLRRFLMDNPSEMVGKTLG